MRGDPHSYQSIAAMMPDEPELIEDENGNLIPCGGNNCGDWSEGYVHDIPMCPPCARDEALWDQADNANDEKWLESEEHRRRIDESANI